MLLAGATGDRVVGVPQGPKFSQAAAAPLRSPPTDGCAETTVAGKALTSSPIIITYEQNIWPRCSGVHVVGREAAARPATRAAAPALAAAAWELLPAPAGVLKERGTGGHPLLPKIDAAWRGDPRLVGTTEPAPCCTPGSDALHDTAPPGAMRCPALLSHTTTKPKHRLLPQRETDPAKRKH